MKGDPKALESSINGGGRSPPTVVADASVRYAAIGVRNAG
jgi:hypothetical protein